MRKEADQLILCPVHWDLCFGGRAAARLSRGPLADSKMGAAASCVGSKEDPITSGDVEVAQEAWAKGIVDIGKVYQDKGD